MENLKITDRAAKRRNGLAAISTIASEHGKVPPQAVELEEALLGALMLEKDALSAVIDILQPECFYKDANRMIFEAIQQLFSKAEAIDILTVTNELKKSGNLDVAGGPYYISQLTNRVASAANVEFHARIILQKYIQRQLISLGSEMIRDGFEETNDAFDLLDKAGENLFNITEQNVRKNYDRMSTLLSQAIREIEAARNHTDGLTGVPTGFSKLDSVTSGWQRSDLDIIAARPGMGKTAFVLSIARNAAVQFNKPVAIFSLEMSSLQLVNRLIAAEAQLSAEKLKKGNLEDHEWQQLNAKITRLAEAPLFIDDTPALSVFELRAKARRLKQQNNIELIIVDYLQLMTAGGDSKGNREQEISTISRSLKSIAKELNVPVIALSQLSRAVENRGGSKRPQLSDLRESGAIEQDADMVMFIYRPEYYGLDVDENNNPTRGLAEIIIAKHRNGALVDVPLRFIDKLAKFEDWETNDFDAPFHSHEEGPNTITRSSRMDDIEDDENQPF
ncbi:MAG: replicative DNA helicase [Flavobacteriales bacterium]|nr:replicative DNA helicase [Flavobacteriales bacterium]MCB9446776.1 replicative DNA helicase [Flavobacteriales bacterium]